MNFNINFNSCVDYYCREYLLTWQPCECGNTLLSVTVRLVCRSNIYFQSVWWCSWTQYHSGQHDNCILVANPSWLSQKWLQTLNVIQALDVIPLRQKQARLQLSLLIDCKVHAKQSANSNSRDGVRYDAPTFVKLLFSFDASKVLRSLRGASTKLFIRRALMNQLKTNRVVIGREQRSLWENWKRKEAEAGGGWYLRDVDEIPAAFKTIGLRVLFSQVHSICCYCTAEQRQKGCRLGAEPERRSRSVDDTDWSDCWGVGKEMAHIGASRSDRVADAVVQPSRNL